MHGEKIFFELSDAIIGCALTVHKELGPGLLETTYESCLAHELSFNNLKFERQKPLPVKYRGTVIDCGYRVDLLVENQAILELKSVEKLLPIHEAQLLTYLKLSGTRMGLLINFNVKLLKYGIRRMVL